MTGIKPPLKNIPLDDLNIPTSIGRLSLVGMDAATFIFNEIHGNEGLSLRFEINVEDDLNIPQQ